MPLRALCILLVLGVVTPLASAAVAPAQSRQGDLSELWNEYPLVPRVEGPGPVGAREESGSTAGPPPAKPAGPPPVPAKSAGPLPLALLFLALGLAVVGVTGGALQGLGRLRERRRERGRLGAGAGNLGG
jgi:hypothetical protein